MNLRMNVTVNGETHDVDVPAHWTLLQLLRDGLALLGTEEGCGEGSCGSCSVMVDDGLVRSCLYLAARVDGRSVVTVEGLSDADELSSVQAAFVTHGSVQCGFCIPGLLMVATALLEESPHISREQLREGLSGNFCRCGSYPQILDAVTSVSMDGADQPEGTGNPH